MARGPDLANLNVYVNKRLGLAIKRFIATTKPRPTKTSAVELAIEKLLESEGIPIPTDTEVEAEEES